MKRDTATHNTAKMFEDIPWSAYAATIAAVGWGVLYLISSTAETSLVKALNYESNVWLPMYSALLVNQLWIFVLPSYCVSRWRRSQRRKVPAIEHDELGTPRQFRAGPGQVLSPRRIAITYIAFGLITFAITCLRNVAVNSIPGSVFSLLISTSIMYNMVLSRILLKRSITVWHIAAALCCLAAAACIGIASFLSGANTAAQGHHYSVGIPAALGAAFFIALMSVQGDHMMSTWPDKDFYIAEMTIVASLIASALLVPVLFATNENDKWLPELSSAVHASTRSKNFLITCSVMLPFAKALVRTSKYETISFSSALFFEFVQAGTALISSFANILLFSEPWNWGLVVALPLILLSFVLYGVAKRRSKNVGPPQPDIFKTISKSGVQVDAYRNSRISSESVDIEVISPASGRIV